MSRHSLVEPTAQQLYVQHHHPSDSEGVEAAQTQRTNGVSASGATPHFHVHPCRVAQALMENKVKFVTGPRSGLQAETLLSAALVLLMRGTHPRRRLLWRRPRAQTAAKSGAAYGFAESRAVRPGPHPFRSGLSARR